MLQQFHITTVMNFSKMVYDAPESTTSNWSPADYLGMLKVRSSLGRNNYQVSPGLYKLGDPGKDSEVIVTSNYKLSFDIVRKKLEGMDAWILVLQTFGINVWCAAGKGTFGTTQLVKQIKDTQLQNYVGHKRVIVPQLGAPGVAAHKVRKETGFQVKFGPVRAEDITDYIAAGYKKTDGMRAVQFNFIDRLILTPVELVNSLKYLIIGAIVVFLIAGLTNIKYDRVDHIYNGLMAVSYLLTAYLTGAFLSPILLPWLPSRFFAAKGMFAGFITFGLIFWLMNSTMPVAGIVGWLLLSGAVSSFLAMNFTGASTYTSLSGVRKEMRLFVPVQLLLTLAGLILIVLSKLV